MSALTESYAERWSWLLADVADNITRAHIHEVSDIVLVGKLHNWFTELEEIAADMKDLYEFLL